MIRIAQIIGHPAVNGGTTAFVRLINALKKYENIESDAYVVNNGGRSETTCKELTEGDGVPFLGYYDYPEFAKRIAKHYDLVIQHRLYGTRPLKECKAVYVVVNHTVQGPKELKKFKLADAFVPVSAHLDKTASYPPNIPRFLIRNGIEPMENIEPHHKRARGRIITGRCHRLYGGKFLTSSVPPMSKVPGHKHYIIGKHTVQKRGAVQFLGEITDTEKKMKTIASWDAYFYDTNLAEGTSMAVLEALSAGLPVICKDRGGTNEIIEHKRNGWFFASYPEAVKIIKKLRDNPSLLYKLRANARKSVQEELHVRIMVKKYVEMIRKLGLDP